MTKALLGMILVLAGCQTSPAVSPSSSTVAPAPPTALSTQDEIEALLRQRADAMQRRDVVAFTATIDQSRSTYSRWQTAAFDNAPVWNTRPSTKVAKLEPYGVEYVRIYIADGAKDFLGPSYDGYSREYLRRDQGKWLLSEPLANEIGEARTIAIGPVDLLYWAIDEALISSLRTAVREAWDRASRRLGASVDPGWQLILYPTAESTTAWNPLVPKLINFVPRRIRLSPRWALYDDTLTGLSTLAIDGLASMATGSVLQDRYPSATGVLQASDEWLYRGIALHAFVSRFERETAPLCVTSPITLAAMRRGPDLASAVPEPTGRNVYAYQLLDYLSERSGPTAATDLYAAAERTHESVDSFQSVARSDREHFYADFLAWAQKKFC
jgi:hypothetical protein